MGQAATNKQAEFDWTRAEQLGAINQAQFPRGLGCTPVVIKSVLRAIDSFGRGREAWPSVPTIAQTAGASERSAKRAIAALVELSVLCVEKRWRGAATVNHYTIVWSELNLLEQGKQERPVAQTIGRSSSGKTVVTVDASGQVAICSVGPNVQSVGPNMQSVGPNTLERGAKLAHKDNKNNTQETTTTTDALVVVVSQCGVARAERAVALARERGLSDDASEELCRLWRELPELQRLPGVLFNWLTLPGSYQAPRAVAAAGAGQRGDAWTREQRERESLRCRIVRAGRAAGAPEAEIERRLAAAGV